MRPALSIPGQKVQPGALGLASIALKKGRDRPSKLHALVVIHASDPVDPVAAPRPGPDLDENELEGSGRKLFLEHQIELADLQPEIPAEDLSSAA